MMMLSFLDGTKPSAESFATYLAVPVMALAKPFERLNRSGVFTKKYDAYADQWLFDKVSPAKVNCAWGMLGGVAAGQIYRNYR